MSIDDAIASGAQALHDDTCPDDECGGLHGEDRDALTAARAMWPILSEGLRELHRQKINFRPRRLDGGAHLREECQHCGPRVAWPCATVRELERIDKELGND